MKREIFTTRDGSHSIKVEELRESFHSENGSIQESLHTFINSGLDFFTKTFGKAPIDVFEVGFGTGLNALLTQKWANKNEIKCNYTSVEAYPLEDELWQKLNYFEKISGINQQDFFDLHLAKWQDSVSITQNFDLTKINQELESFETIKMFDVVFFDAFAPKVQPQLWTDKVFSSIYKSMNENSVLVTYSAAGVARRNMAKAGFWIDEIKGAAGKREMTRAIKW